VNDIDAAGRARYGALMDMVRSRMTVRAFPVLNAGSEIDRMYKENAEPILLQSVAAATMSAHLAAAALSDNVCWVTASARRRRKSPGSLCSALRSRPESRRRRLTSGRWRRR
jgi:hypothetical protein